MSGEAAPAEEASAPLLSICIPTYNRARHVEAAVQVLLAHVLSDPAADAEVVVAVNGCTDDTLARLAPLRRPRLRVVETEAHYDTAEENMMRALAHLRGRYVWFLGDDDVFDPLGFARLTSLLREDRHDCLIFNSPVISPSGTMINRQPIPMNAPQIEAGVAGIVEAVGLLFTFAGVSNVVQRRDALSEARGLEWLGRSPIYSHVAWMAQAHAGGRVLLVNGPLVRYRQNDYSDGHWQRVAARKGVQDRFFWTLGLVRLISPLVEAGVLGWGQVGRITETAADGRRYNLVLHIVFETHAQLQLWAGGADPRQRLSTAEFDELRLFCLRADPSLYDLLAMLEARASELEAGGAVGDLDRTFQLAFASRLEEMAGGGRFLGRFSGYDAYGALSGCVAVDAGDPDLTGRVLAEVDPQPQGTAVLVGAGLDELAALAAAARALRAAEPPFEAENPEEQPLARPLWRRALGRVGRMLS